MQPIEDHSHQKLRAALDELYSRVGGKPSDALLQTFLSGREAELSYHDRLRSETTGQPSALTRMFLVAESSLRQPSLEHFYDIYRAARYVPLTYVLRSAVEIVLARVKGGAERIARLRDAGTLDALEATIFELAVAARYASHPRVSGAEFLPEGSLPTPDFSVILDGERERVVVECKKFDRINDGSQESRDQVRAACGPLLSTLLERDISASFEARIMVAPEHLSGSHLLSLGISALESGGTILDKQVTITGRRIRPLKLASYKLMPSPEFYWEQYEFKAREWQGIVSLEKGRMAGPSWVDHVAWTAAVKWSLFENEELWKRQKLGFARMFKGIDQLNEGGSDRTILHVAYDREGAIGHRRDALLRFLREADKKGKYVTWIVFNELDIDVSMGGRWDFIEHAHFVGHRTPEPTPLVTRVFTPGEGQRAPRELFGIGVALPALD